MFKLQQVSLLALCALAAGCGGGGGQTPAPAPQPPAPVNSPPVFTSAAAVSVPENVQGPAHQAQASDPDGNVLSFSISGGTDQALFSITAGGALSFVTPPDFEAPGDADRNNVYSVQVRVSDGTASVSQDLLVTVTNAGPDSFRVRRVGNGFSRPVFVAPVPDDTGQVFVVEQTGAIRILNPATGAVTTFLDIRDEVIADADRGLLGFATAPDFASSGAFYLFLSNAGGTSELRRYTTLSGNRAAGDRLSRDTILAIPQPFTENKGGWIGFGPDGYLYIATGDGGGVTDPHSHAQRTDSLLGKVLRIGVSGDDFPGDATRDYTIPPDNPFVSKILDLKEIWAFGLRQPFRASFDAATGRLWIGDRMETASEEINMMGPSNGGANFGWSCRQGNAIYGTCLTTAGLVAPVFTYNPPVGIGNRRVTGGYVYRGPVEALRGQYFLGDFLTGEIWSLPASEVSFGQQLSASRVTARTDLKPVQGTIDRVASFGLDQAGNLYVIDADGEIFRLEAQ